MNLFMHSSVEVPPHISVGLQAGIIMTAGMRCLCSEHYGENISALVFPVRRSLLQKSRGLFRCSFVNLSSVAMFFSGEAFSWQPCKQAILVWSVSICADMNLLPEACRGW